MLYPVLGNFGSSIFIMFLFQNKFPENYSMAWSQSITRPAWAGFKTALEEIATIKNDIF